MSFANASNVIPVHTEVCARACESARASAFLARLPDRHMEEPSCKHGRVGRVEVPWQLCRDPSARAAVGFSS